MMYGCFDDNIKVKCYGMSPKEINYVWEPDKQQKTLETD